MQILEGFRRLFTRTRRRVLSKYPSAKTPQLEQAWKEPQFRYSPTYQPFTSPLALHGTNLTGETAEMRQEYREWSFREPPVKAAILTKIISVAQLEPQLNPENKKDARDREACEWVDWSVSHAVGGWPGLIQNMALPALIDGFSVLEKQFKEVETIGRKYTGFWTYSKFAMIDTELLRFRLDPYRQVIGVRPVTGVASVIELPPEDFVIFTHLKMFENPFGISDLRAVVRDVRLLEAAVQFRHLLLANFSGPFIWAKSPDESVRSMLLGVLAEARSNGFVVVPEGTELEVFNLATSSPAVFDSAIQSYRENIVSAIQGGYLQLLTGGITDARGNTEVHDAVAQLYQWWLATWVCEVINLQVIPDIVVPAFGNSVGMPRLTLGGIDEQVVSAALDRFKRGQELGVKLSDEQVRSVGGFEVPRDPQDVLAPPSAAPQPGQQPDPFGGMFNQRLNAAQMGESNGYQNNGHGSAREVPALPDSFRDYAELLD